MYNETFTFIADDRICDNISSSKESEDMNMSLVGMMFNDNGIVAFGDSRGTELDVEKNKSFKSDNVKKVFKHQNFLLATCGANTFYNNDKYLCNLSDVIEEIIIGLDKDAEYSDFLKIFQTKSQSHFLRFYNDRINFIIGSKDSDGLYHVDSYVVKKDMLDLVKHTYIPEMLIVGDLTLFDKQIPVPFQWSLDEMKKRSELFVSSIIGLNEALLFYSSIGGPVQIEALV